MLNSFHYYKKWDYDDLIGRFAVRPMVFADSGAYSAASQNATVQIDDYVQWLHRWRHYFTAYANLDVIRDARATARNQAILEREGLEPVPVFHTGSDFAELDRLAERYPYIALGGMVGQSRDACLRWSATCMKRTAKHGTRFHGFGMTSLGVVEKLPWFSVDSSSWISGARFGSLRLYDGRTWIAADIGNRKQIASMAPLIRRLGFEPETFADRSRYKATAGHMPIAVMCGLSWRMYERRLQSRSAVTNLYLANTYAPYFVAIDNALREGKEVGLN